VPLLGVNLIFCLLTKVLEEHTRLKVIASFNLPSVTLMIDELLEILDDTTVFAGAFSIN
jgi:hypothetical protein